MTRFSVWRNIDLQPGHAWHVVHVIEGRERAALHAIFNDGLRVYMPSLVVETRYRCRTVRPVRLPLLPGYLFVGLDPDNLPDMRRWRRQGVEGLLMRVGMPGTPATVSDEAVVSLWLAEDRGLLKRRIDKARAQGCGTREGTEEEMRRSGKLPGAQVRLSTDDVFNGLMGRIVEAEPDMRLSLLMQWFGGATVVHGVPIDKVEVL